jgi:DNA helicase-2/ATP-dependent DNA helicase PcrA
MSNEFLWLSAFLKLASRPLDEKCLDQMTTAFNRVFDLQVQTVEILAASALSSKPYVLEWQKQIGSVADQNADAVALSKLASNFALESSSFRKFTQAVLKRIDNTLSERSPEDAIQGDMYEDREAWRDLYRTINQSIGRDAELDAFVQELSLRSKEPPKKANDVSLMTIHASKGREFDHVYLIGLAEDVLPSYHSLKSGSTSAEMEEERRNCFVAITRACEWLCLSYADSYRGWSKQPSRFLTEMELELPATPLTSS